MTLELSELSGAELDAAVARAQGWSRKSAGPMHTPAEDWWTDEDGRLMCAPLDNFCPSQSWRDGGPIIERERIMLTPYAHDGEYAYDATGNNPMATAPARWYAEVMDADEGGWIERCPERAESGHGPIGIGPTPLIAAMRAFVASKT